MSKDLDQARAAYEAARAECISETESFCNRSDGSGRQEAMAEERLERARANQEEKRRELETAERRHQELKAQQAQQAQQAHQAHQAHQAQQAPQPQQPQQPQQPKDSEPG